MRVEHSARAVDIKAIHLKDKELDFNKKNGLKIDKCNNRMLFNRDPGKIREFNNKNYLTDITNNTLLTNEVLTDTREEIERVKIDQLINEEYSYYLNLTNENGMAATSHIQGISMAENVVNRVKYNMLNNSSIAILSQHDKNPQKIFNLLE